MTAVSGSRLRRLARRSASVAGGEDGAGAASYERCELCGETIPAAHRHLLDLSSRELMCACQACKILFDRPAAGGDHYRLVPDRRLELADLDLPDPMWEGLRIPVELAFFFINSAEERVQCFYPSPAGPTESLLDLYAWTELESANPVLRSMEPDVEALLVNRARGARQHFLVPIEDCYALVGLIRTRWRGLSGGQEVWEGIDEFFATTRKRSKPTARDGGDLTMAPAAEPGL